ncbi:agmatinase [Sediminicola luteus]|uniref:Agmatinase n=1 Tax=Sediminicola luteus TaxID=319238 RepID=A0A2A4G1Y3_9FLAO|nr:agmatinase [Sediminicola luteus]PCE62989.1 agmatinase [Sediminicola luteus]
MENNKNFAGIPDRYAALGTSNIVLLPVPYDGTSTWGKGADKGPQAFLDAAGNMELYDIETGSEVYRRGIYLAPPILEDKDPESMVEEVYRATKKYILKKKFVSLFGGEHSISIGAIRAMGEMYRDLTVVQLDAHADLRKTYMGSPFNHACAMYEASENHNLIQLGIRSMDVSELTMVDKEKIFYAHEMLDEDYWMDNAIELMTENVYLTFDLDVFDPSVLPATGTPEPGGLPWYPILAFLRKLFEEKNVVGMDIVELCPHATSAASEFTAAKLYYKMLSYKFENEKTPWEGEVQNQDS